MQRVGHHTQVVRVNQVLDRKGLGGIVERIGHHAQVIRVNQVLGRKRSGWRQRVGHNSEVVHWYMSTMS